MQEISWQIIDWNMTIGGSPPLWRIIIAIMIMLIAILLAIVLSRYLPRYIAQIIRVIDERSKKIYGKKGEKKQRRELGHQLRTIDRGVRRFVWWTILIVFGFVTIKSLGFDIYTEFSIMDYPFTLWMIIQFFIIILIFIIFIKTILSPITKLLLQALFLLAYISPSRSHFRILRTYLFIGRLLPFLD